MTEEVRSQRGRSLLCFSSEPTSLVSFSDYYNLLCCVLSFNFTWVPSAVDLIFCTPPLFLCCSHFPLSLSHSISCCSSHTNILSPKSPKANTDHNRPDYITHSASQIKLPWTKQSNKKQWVVIWGTHSKAEQVFQPSHLQLYLCHLPTSSYD